MNEALAFCSEDPRGKETQHPQIVDTTTTLGFTGKLTAVGGDATVTITGRIIIPSSVVTASITARITAIVGGIVADKIGRQDR